MKLSKAELRLTAKRLREVYGYDPKTGVFTRLIKSRGGKAALEGIISTQGYRQLSIDNIHYQAHRCAWMYVTGALPLGLVEHVNSNQLDNRFDNLRLKAVGRGADGKPNEALTVERLRDALYYDPETGFFTWRESSARIAKGLRAGGATGNGYHFIGIDARRYLAHRLAWLYVHGRWPEHFIDHINGDPSDNRLVNLREANNAQNSHNRSVTSRSATGLKGVSRKGKRFKAQITVDYHIIPLGVFDTPEEAHVAYRAAAIRFQGAFAHAQTTSPADGSTAVAEELPTDGSTPDVSNMEAH